MTNPIDELHSGSFRDAGFLVRRTSTTGGRNIVSHEFINSDFREVEDIGLNLKKFSITAVIAAPESASKTTHQSLKDKLIRALDEEGPGTLWHPFYGKFTVKSGIYVINDDMTRLGETTFDLSFEIETDQLLTAPVIDTILDVKEKEQSLSKRLGLDVAKGYFNSGISAINSATDFASDISSKIESVSDLYSQAFSAVSELTASVQKIKNDVINIINLPGRMASDMSGLFDRIEDIYTIKKSSGANATSPLSKDQIAILGDSDEINDDIKSTLENEQSILSLETKGDLDKTESDFNRDKFDSYSKLFDFNKNSIKINEILSDSGVDLIGNDAGLTASASLDVGNTITEEQAEIIRNEKLLSRQIRVTALGKAYVSSIEIDYKTTDEIEEIQVRLENQYQSVIADLYMPKETIKALQILRDTVERYLFQQKLTVNQIIEIEINETPAQVLSFELYGDTSKTLDLAGLNDEYDVGHLSGTVKVLTA